MRPTAVFYMGATIHPIVTRNASGFACMTVIAEPGYESRGSGMLGTFDTADQAYDCAVEFGRSEVERHRLLTLVC
jgi:hypothetical protein